MNLDKIVHNLRQVVLSAAGAFSSMSGHAGGVFSPYPVAGQPDAGSARHGQIHVRQRRLGRCMNFSLKHDVLDLLRDPFITAAAQEIVADKRSRRERFGATSSPIPAGSRGSRGRACVRRCSRSPSKTCSRRLSDTAYATRVRACTACRRRTRHCA